ncbi:MAG: glycoside hydrolase family 5 protein [Velocimicrobium sp.]
MLKQHKLRMRSVHFICFAILISQVMILLTGCKSDEVNAIQYTKDLKAGWNLGNALEAYNCEIENPTIEDYQTYWQNPLTTKEMIDEVKAKGFQTIRIPVTWSEHMNDSGVIDEDWMNRVQEVVDYGIDNGMNVIINAHHDDWYAPSAENKEYGLQMMATVWEQIGTKFADYDDHLLFEGMNEPRLIGTDEEWNGGSSESREIVNELNAAFVETIRSLGGKNKTRFLLIPTYGANSSEDAIRDMKVPKDGRLIVSIHAYIPYEFAMKYSTKSEWSATNSEDMAPIDTMMENLYSTFIQKGIPVIIGEFGAENKGNEEARTQWTDYYVKSAMEHDIPCFWWDNGGAEKEYAEFSLFDRFNLQWNFDGITEALLQQNE